MTYECRIYPHPSIITTCVNCQDVKVTTRDKKITKTRCKRYKQDINFHSALNGKYPCFCKLHGGNGIDRMRIYPDPIIIYCCWNCPANRRDPSAPDNIIPLRYRCFEYEHPLTVDDLTRAMDGIFPSFCELEKVKK